MKRRISLEIIGLSVFWVTGILTANRLLSDTTEEADLLDSLPFAVHRRMDVKTQRCRNVGVSQHFAQTFYIDTLFDTPRSIGVTKCVIATLPDTTPTQNRFKIILIGAWLHWLIRSACQDIRIL